ncbi:MAG: HAMP domain-containing sensor histidine kinase [Anditalea sp.]
MKLLNYTGSWFVLVLFLILLVWAGVFYFMMLDEIYDSIDDGLENQKLLVIQKAEQNSAILQRDQFDEGNYMFRKILLQQAMNYRDVYKDTLMYMQNEEDFEPVRMLITAFEQNDQYYEMRVITSMVEEDDLIEDLLFSLLLLFSGLTSSILILNNLLLKKIWQPFYHLLERLKKFRLDDPQPIVPTTSNIEEFRLLDQSVKKLLETNIQAYNDQKQFIENASHELQTPLAISLNKLELLAEYPQKEEQLQLIGSVMDNLERLIRLNKSLLLLSKISNQQFSEEVVVDFNTLLQKAADDFSDQAGFKNITVSLVEKDTLKRKMNPDLARILVVNMLKNAIVHNHPQGFVNVIINDSSIIMENSGKTGPLDHLKIFERFYKNEALGNSTGLGLAIVKTITDIYQVTLTYDYKEKHIFTLIF